MRVIGLDVGTTGAKALVVDESGVIHGQGYREYPLHAAPGGWVTQAAADWKAAVVSSVRGAVEAAGDPLPQAMALSTQASSLAACASLDEAGEVITWMDGRAVEEVLLLDQAVGSSAVYEATGWPLSAGGDAAKVLWLQRQGLWRGNEKLADTLSLINRFLTGRWVADPSNEALRQLYDFRADRYDPRLLQALRLTPDQLPPVLPAGAPIGGLTAEAAGLLGLPQGTPVYNGAHDQYCAALGCGAVAPGDMMLATGTTWVVLGVTVRPLFTPTGICPGRHPAGGYGAIASQINAGSALKWWREQIGGDYAAIDREAAARRESSRDLFFVPHLAGAGFPAPDPAAAGRITGLRLHHDKYDLARALMEGVAFEARRMLTEFEAAGMAPGRLILTGGAAKSDFWTGIAAAVLPRWRLWRADCADAAPLGAALLALTGAGALPDLKTAAALCPCRPLPAPAEEDIAWYAAKYAAYLSVCAKD